MQLIFGINPVLEDLKSKLGRISKIVVARGRGGEGLHKILDLAGKKAIQVEFREKGYLDRESGRALHQGVLGFCRPFAYTTMDDVIANRNLGLKHSLILLLDGITDPQNLGTLIRTAHCCGASGIIIPRDRSAAVSGSVIKTSAGTADYTPIAKVVNLVGTIDYLKGQGFWIYGTDPVSGNDIGSVDFSRHVGLVMGSEGRGMRQLIRKQCDFLLSIPMAGRIGSLNVSVAAGIILYEILRAFRKA